MQFVLFLCRFILYLHQEYGLNFKKIQINLDKKPLFKGVADLHQYANLNNCILNSNYCVPFI